MSLVSRSIQKLTSTPALAFVLAWLAWPVSSLAHPKSFQIDSWPTALHLAAEHQFHWGSAIDYTYGPLGFLRFPLAYFAGPMRLSLIYTALTLFALSFSLLYALRREYGAIAASLLTLLALLLVIDERAAAVVFIWAVIAVRGAAPAAVRRWFPAAAGAIAGLEMLVKFNSGIVVLATAITATLVLGRHRARNLVWVAGSFGLAFAVLWLLAGQRLADIGAYVNGSKEIVGGYSAALSSTGRDTTWNLAFAFVTAAVVFAMAGGARRARTGGARWGPAALWTVAGYLLFKEGFVRSDAGHRPIFFGFALCALLAVAANRRRLLPVALASAVIAFALLQNLSESPLSVLTPGAHATVAVGQLRAMVDDGRRVAIERTARSRLQWIYGLDARAVAELRHRPVTVMPWEFAAAIAYDLRWQPLATIQPSSAYTTQLDDHFEDGVMSAQGPRRILRSNRLTLDSRNTAWDAPIGMQAILCHYRQLSAVPRWQVLSRAGNRCGRWATVATVMARWGQTVSVPPPRPGYAMFVDIRGVDPAGLERWRTLAYKAPPRFAIVNGALTYRLVPGTAADGLVLWVPRAADYTPPFQFSQAARTLSVRRGDGGQSGSGRLSYEFETVPIHPFT
ncbi:MAG: hypothetical protein QOD76_1707 [Solirubrobacteraceae bacterium]|nr:hypothetical protein [Solirubrobacteraceae bacterium]